jgi:hypothetical protein
VKQLPRIIIDAVLYCPHCGARHVDEARNGEKWHRRAHTTHRCQACGGDFDVYVSGQAVDEQPDAPESEPRISPTAALRAQWKRKPVVGDRVRVVDDGNLDRTDHPAGTEGIVDECDDCSHYPYRVRFDFPFPFQSGANFSRYKKTQIEILS